MVRMVRCRMLKRRTVKKKREECVPLILCSTTKCDGTDAQFEKTMIAPVHRNHHGRLHWCQLARNTRLDIVGFLGKTEREIAEFFIIFNFKSRQ